MQLGARGRSFSKFDDFVLDIRTGELSKAGGQSIRLPEQSFQILTMLLERPGDVESREEIRKRLWPNDTVVEFEHSISAAMNRLRQALGDSASDPSYIETLARRGYRWMRLVEWSDNRNCSDTVETPAASAASSSPSLIGRKVSHCRVLEFIGGGGMGVVYKAEDIKLARLVALKFLPEELSGDQQALARFEREARAASSLNHPNICTIYEVDEYQGQPFIVMEFLEGDTLRETISANAGHEPQELTKLLALAVQIAEGLKAAHEKNIVHRDVKPSNIFLTKRGVAKLLDFGIVKLLEPDRPAAPEVRGVPPNITPQTDANKFRDLHLTRTGAALGTEGYMSPEQVRGEDLDARTDLFSFGLVLYEITSGQRAFTGDTAAMVEDAILHHSPTPVRRLAPEIPGALETTIDRALQKDREVRYQTAAEMMADLNKILTAIKSEPSATSPSQVSTASRPSAQSPSLIRTPILSPLRIGIAVAALLVVCATVGSRLWIKFRPYRHAETKEQQLTINSNDNPVFDAAISGDGKYLAFSDSFGIHLRLLQTGETHDIAQPAEFRDTQIFWRIRWLPDSTRFLAVSILNKDLPPITWQISVVGETLRKVLDDALVMSVSPDGSTVAFTRVWRRELWLMGPHGETPRKLSDAGNRSSYWSVVWSPDGKRLLYIRNDWSGPGLKVTMETRDLKDRPVTTLLSDGRLRSLHWLGDGRILYVLGDPDVSGDTCNYWVTRMDLKTGKFSLQPTQLTHSVGYCMNATSSTSDSKRLVFLKQSNEYSVYVAGLASGATSITPPKHLTLTAAEEFPSAWSPDSKSIIFVSNRDRTWGFYRQPLNEGPATLIQTGIDSEGLGYIFPRVSPDGKWLIYAAFPKAYEPGNRVDLLRVPAAGGPTEKILSDAIFDTPRCAQFPAIGCVMATLADRTHLAFFSFDPVLGRGHEVARFEVEPERDYGWALSPDGGRIAITEKATADIHILSLATGADQKVTVQHWNNL
ncbi:protein kinase domain-containing protein [Tunturiibacter gelidiferens]|uniref:protein kinase domain-containing protein n=1 Tax=Tunturiibacter gelidiferens TaxID=3069689 RepID=UPI003D9B1AF8